ncbi:hypothetical protein ABZS66_51530 [Dactylosporangium sp. NPDC005572]
MTQQESAKRIGRRGMLTGLGAAAAGAGALAPPTRSTLLWG